VIAAVGVAGLVWLAVAGQAQASGQVTPRQSGGQGMLRVVVQPGQTLWSIAVRAEPTADPRVVVQQIIDANSLASPAIEPGEVLRVPRD
jgi:LysM repeat protein